MEPVRVIGRIDLAEEVHRALSDAGADARLTTEGPSAVVAATSRDEAGIDVIVGAFGTCAAIKKAVPARPVVLVIAPGLEAFAALAAKGSRGPDAYVAWPASGREIMAACDRARDSAGAPRPRMPWQILGLRTLALLVLTAALFLCVAVVMMVLVSPAIGVPILALTFLVLALMLLGFAAWEWKRAPTTRHPRRRRVWSILNLLLAGWLLVMAAAAVSRRLP
jgi:hypothetical protein